MALLDPYDPSVAFDDLSPEQLIGTFSDPFAVDCDDGGGEEVRPPVDPAAVVRATREFLTRSMANTITPPMSFEVIGTSLTTRTFALPRTEMLGADAGDQFPIYTALRKRYEEAAPEPKIVRVDDDDSYVAFRVSRLEDRLSDLEQRFDDHVSDPSAHAIPVPPDLSGKVLAWRDGDEILCTMRTVGPDGIARCLTTGAPAMRYVDDVLGCAINSRVQPEIALAAIPAAACVLGAASLFKQLCEVAPEAMGCMTPVVGVARPRHNAAHAAALSLAQKARRGHRGAKRELKHLSPRMSLPVSTSQATTAVRIQETLRAVDAVVSIGSLR